MSISELALLDGKVSENTQSTIDAAKKESSYGFDDFPVMNELLKKAEFIGSLRWSSKSIRSCSYCDKKRDYQRYPRTGRNHSKGDKNYDKPISYYGIIYNEGFVSMQGYGDMCSDCHKLHRVNERIIDYIIDNNLQIEIMKNEYRYGRYIKDNIKICYNCNEEIQESKMGTERTMMGDGYYPSSCPNCKADSKLFGKNHILTKKFAMIDNPYFKEEIKVIERLVITLNESREKDDKIGFYQSKNNINVFFVQENKFSNGYQKLITVFLKSKKFDLDQWSKNKVETISNYLLEKEYIETKKGD